MSKKTFLTLPVTGDTFAEIREKNRYYVDKTPYLKQVFSEDEAVDENSLITTTKSYRSCSQNDLTVDLHFKLQ